MKLSRRRTAKHQDGDGDSYWISFSDLMSALLVVFILAVVVLVLQLSEKQQEVQAQQDHFNEQIGTLQKAEVVRKEILEEIQTELQQQGIEVLITENNSVISVPSEKLGFAASSFEIDKAFEPVALAIGSVISERVREDDRMEYLDTVFVEGHTDNMAFDGLEGTGNWGLSTFRAISLWSLWEDKLPASHKLSALENLDKQLLFSVSGYAETRPVSAIQKNDAEREVNRRIDIRFTIVRPDAEDLINISKMFKEDGL